MISGSSWHPYLWFHTERDTWEWIVLIDLWFLISEGHIYSMLEPKSAVEILQLSVYFYPFFFFCYASVFFFWDKIKDIITILKGADVSWSIWWLPYKKHCIFLCDKNNTKWEYRAQNERRLKIGHFWHLSRLNLSLSVYFSLSVAVNIDRNLKTSPRNVSTQLHRMEQ